MSLYTRARKHIDMNRVKELREERIKEEKIAEAQKQQEEILAEMKRIQIKGDPKYYNWRREVDEDESARQIALQEQQYLLHFVQNTVPKHYDWRTGKFNTNSMKEVNELVLKRLEDIDDALSEGMSSKGFEYLYGGIVTYDIVSMSPTLVSSTFAQDLINASSEVTSHMFGPNFPGSHINSIGDYEVDSSRRVNVNAYYDSTYGSASGSGSAFTLNTVAGAGAASRASLQSALGITLPTGIPNGTLTGTPTEGSAVQRTFTGAKVGNIINFTWGFTSSEKGLPHSIKVDDYAFVAISGRTTKFVSILGNGDVKGGSFKYRLKASDIDASGNVKVSIGVVDVHDKLYNTTLRVTNFGSLYGGDIGTIGDTTDAADLGMPVKPPKKDEDEIAQGFPYTDEDDAFDDPYYQGPPPDLDDDSDFDPNDFEYASADWPKGDPSKSPPPIYKPGGGGWPNVPGVPQPFQGQPGPKYPLAKNKSPVVAHHEPQGEVLSEKKRLKSVKDFSNYPGKPSPMGFPEEDPPKMINGYHPDLVDGEKVSQRFNRLDPISARAMPLTGNPHIDKKVRAAAKKPK